MKLEQPIYRSTRNARMPIGDIDKFKFHASVRKEGEDWIRKILSSLQTGRSTLITIIAIMHKFIWVTEIVGSPPGSDYSSSNVATSGQSGPDPVGNRRVWTKHIAWHDEYADYNNCIYRMPNLLFFESCVCLCLTPCTRVKHVAFIYLRMVT
jgi:hypothetical protein